MPTVLYVDDETSLRHAAQVWLGHHGVDVVTARSVDGALRILARQPVDGAFVELWLADGSGFELYAHLEERYRELARRVVCVTGDIVPSEATSAHLRMIGRPVLFKPFDLRELDHWVRHWRDDRAGASAPEPHASGPADVRPDARAEARADAAGPDAPGPDHAGARIVPEART
jgi:DNA-binding NtrC family response regulator